VPEDALRTRAARRAAEQALVRVVHHYGGTPEFVLLGGLVPELLCSSSGVAHAGTSDVDVQVNLEVAAGSANMARLEEALANAEFTADPKRVWRWQTDVDGQKTVVKFELLADLDSEPAGAVISFNECDQLGAINLRGTGFAAQDFSPRPLRARIGGLDYAVHVNVTELAGFLLAKVAAAYGRRAEKDWYDITFVLLHNDHGGPDEAARLVLTRFGGDLIGSTRTALDDLSANFSRPRDQGPNAYATQMLIDRPDLHEAPLRADSVVAVRTFYTGLFPDQA
jgi:hypothetical protein